MRMEFVQATASNNVTNAALPGGGAPNAASSQHRAAKDVFAQLLNALGHQVADTSGSAPAPSIHLDLAGSRPAPSPPDETDDPSRTATGGLNLRSVLNAFRIGSTKPAADSTKLAARTPSGNGSVDGSVGPDPASATPPTADASPMLVQLLAALQNAPAAPIATATSVSGANAQTAAPQAAAGMLAAAIEPADKTAAGIVPAGTPAKPARAAKSDDPKGTADSERTQNQSSPANVLNALSATASRTFTGQPGANGLPVHSSTDHGSDAKPSADGSNSQSGNSHSHAASPANDVRTGVAPAPSVQNLSVADSRPATAQAPPPADAGAVAATNGLAPTGPAANASPAAFPINLQVHAASALAVPDTNALAITIVAKSEAGQKHFDIRLDPPELGRVDVRLTMDDAGKAQASLAVEKPQTLELLQKDSSTLERALKDAGLDLSQNGLNFSLKGQQQQGGNENSPSARGRALQVRAIAAVEPSPTILSTSGVGASDTRLDIRV